MLTDRGPESAELFRAVAAPGWHPLMRAEARGRSRPAGWHKGYAMTAFAPGAGRRWSGAGVAYPSAGVPLACTLLASRDAGHAEPWLVLTDPPARGADAAWSAWRV